MIKQIKYNRTYLLLDKYFDELSWNVLDGNSIEQYYDGNKDIVLNIYHTDKCIMFKSRFLPEEIRNNELLYEYLKEFTSFKDYTISEW